MAIVPARVELVVSRWGNSLAVRLPADSLKAIGIAEGDKLLMELSPDGRLVLAPEKRRVGRAAIARLRRFLAGQEETAEVVTKMRRNARY